MLVSTLQYLYHSMCPTMIYTLYHLRTSLDSICHYNTIRNDIREVLSDSLQIAGSQKRIVHLRTESSLALVSSQNTDPTQKSNFDQHHFEMFEHFLWTCLSITLPYLETIFLFLFSQYCFLIDIKNYLINY